MTQGIITKTGNSYAIRVPKRYIVDNHLQLGDVVALDEPLARQQQALVRLQQRAIADKPLTNVDPVAWQRAIRASSDPWQNISYDPAR